MNLSPLVVLGMISGTSVDGLDAADLRLVGLAIWRTTVRST